MLEKFYRRWERLLNFTAFHMSNLCAVDVVLLYPFDQIPLSGFSLKYLQCRTKNKMFTVRNRNPSSRLYFEVPDL